MGKNEYGDEMAMYEINDDGILSQCSKIKQEKQTTHCGWDGEKKKQKNCILSQC